MLKWYIWLLRSGVLSKGTGIEISLHRKWRGFLKHTVHWNTGIQLIIIIIIFFTSISVNICLFQIPNEGSLALVISLIVLQGVTGISFGLVISSAIDDEQSANQAALGIFYPNLIISGTLSDLTDVKKWIWWHKVTLWLILLGNIYIPFIFKPHTPVLMQPSILRLSIISPFTLKWCSPENIIRGPYYLGVSRELMDVNHSFIPQWIKLWSDGGTRVNDDLWMREKWKGNEKRWLL